MNSWRGSLGPASPLVLGSPTAQGGIPASLSSRAPARGSEREAEVPCWDRARRLASSGGRTCGLGAVGEKNI